MSNIVSAPGRPPSGTVSVALAPLTNAPAWAVIAAAAIGVLQIVTDVVFSTKTSDWKKFRRERAVAKDLRRR